MKKLTLVLLLLALMSMGVSAIQAQDDEGAEGEGWSIVGEIPEEVVPTKFANGEADEESCDIPGSCWMFDEAGVLSAARYEDAEANPSAVWSGAGDVQELLEGETATVILPESGYLMAVGAGFDVTCGAYSVGLEPDEDHAWFFLIRGRADGRGDRNVQCTFSNYTEGAVLVTMYAIPVEASAFFSQGYFTDNVENAHVRKNCGSSGCEYASALVLDINDGAFSVLTHDEDGFELEVTNTVADE